MPVLLLAGSPRSFPRDSSTSLGMTQDGWHKKRLEWQCECGVHNALFEWRGVRKNVLFVMTDSGRPPVAPTNRKRAYRSINNTKQKSFLSCWACRNISRKRCLIAALLNNIILLSPRGGVDFPDSGKGGSHRLTKRGRLRRGAVSNAKNERLTIEGWYSIITFILIYWKKLLVWK